MNKYVIDNKDQKHKKLCHEDINLLQSFLLLPAPYEIKNNIRFLRNSSKLVSEKFNIIVTYKNSSKKCVFKSISACSKSLGLCRSTIKKYLLSGEEYLGFKFHKNL
jgi:hypothetical protein